MYDNLDLVKSVVGSISGGYNLVAYTHEPDSFDNTIVLCAGMYGSSKKDVVSLAFTALKLFTDDNPHLVALRSNTNCGYTCLKSIRLR
ncbi:hypothetical protein [Psychrobacter sp. WY6]|uniref:hypothetical protein n=1 Tax=Psychrobacter sp. WY6 TaxID=2708350 RepID=UPI002022CE75|nr:hypothetical protein [Psychrobacter sp. WY6]